MALVVSILNELQLSLKLAGSVATAEKSKVQAIEEKAHGLFMGAYKQFVNLESNRNSALLSNQSHSELHVTAAEAAFATKEQKIAREILEEYFRCLPQQDSYYVRGKLALALLLDYEADGMSGDESIARRKLAVAEVMVALNISTDPSNANRYKFLVFNCSVVLWRVAHRYLRAGRARFFAEGMARMSAAVEGIDDADKTWRVMFLSATAFALEDADQKKAGSEALDKALDIAEKEVAIVQEREKEREKKMLEAKSKSDALMLAQRTKETYEELLHKPPRIDPDAEGGVVVDDPTRKLPELTGLAALPAEELKYQLDDAQEILVKEKEALKIESDLLHVQTTMLHRLYLQRVNIFPSDTKRVTGAAPVINSMRAKVLVQLQSIRSGAVQEKDWTSTFAQMISLIDAAADPTPPPAAGGKKGAAVAAPPPEEVGKPQVPASVVTAICETLFDMSRCAWTLGLRDLAIQYSERADKENSLSPVIRVKSDLCKAIRMVAEISSDKPNEETEARLTELQLEGHANNKRIEALKLLERVIGVCFSRLDDSALLQEIAIVIWNTAIPLLQSHLRQNVYRAFQLAAGCLEEIASPLMRLRAQLHFELAKCEEQNDFVVKAKTQAVKALHADYGDLYEASPAGAAPVADKKGAAPAESAPSAVNACKLEGEELDRRRNMDVLIKPLDNILSLRSSVYDTPEDIESQVLLMMQQVAESKSRNFQTDSLFRSMSALLSAIENPNDHAAANAILGNGSIPPPISKLKAALTPPDLNVLTETLDKFGSTAASAAPAAAAPAKGKAAEPVAAAPSVEFSVFTEVTQCRLNLMYAMAKTASKLGEEAAVIVQRAACYLLSFNWNPDDGFMRSLVLQQIDVANLLTEALVVRIAHCELSEEQEEKYMLALEGFVPNENESAEGQESAVATAATEKDNSNTDKTDAARPPVIEPRCLGVTSVFASEEMQQIKSIIIKSVAEALKISLRVKDDYSIQNGIVFFWNLHLHVFRRSLGHVALPEMLEFLKLAHETLLAAKKREADKLGTGIYVPPPPEIDFRLCVAICEAYSSVVALLSKDVPGAIDIAVKGCTEETGGPSAYVRRRLCEHAARLSAAPAAPVEAGGKGATKAPTSGEPLKFDHPFLNVFSLLVCGEAVEVTKEAVKGFVAKIRGIIDGDLKEVIDNIDIPNLSKEQYDQLMELRACALTRLTRLYVTIGDVYGAYASAEECTKLIENSLTSNPETEGHNRDVIPPRVWRWMSLCERYFGAAVSLLIKPEGQEISLQNELRMAALRHYTLSSDFGRRAKEDGLVVDSATDAWNTTMPLIDVTSPESFRPTLQQLLYMILDALHGCSEEKYPEGAPAARIGRAADDLKQRFYIAIIEGLIGDCNWDGAMKAALKAFEDVPSEYHRSIWKLRVVIMSKRGKSALDGIQKLKEGDPSLQARVYAVLARSASIPAQQLEAYSKAIEVLATDISKVEYILELAQYLGSGGVPKCDVYDLLLTSLDSLAPFLADPDVPPEDEEDAQDDDETMSKMSGSVRSKGSKSSKGSKARSLRSKGGASVKSAAAGGSKSVASRAASKRGGGSVASRARTAASVMSVDPTLNYDIDPNRSNLKHLDYALRSLAMMAILESQSSLRLKRCLESVYFIDRSIALWNNAMRTTYRRKQFLAIPPPERKELDFAEYSCEIPDFINIPQCSLDLLFWEPSEQFESLALAATVHVETALDVPSTLPFVSLPLTIHYLIELSGYLCTAGFLASSLLCLAWARAVLIMQTNKYSNVTASSIEMEKSFDPIHACIYYKAIYVMKLGGLERSAKALPKLLGRTGRTVPAFVLTFSEETGAYVAGGNALSLTSSVTNREITKSESMNMYGFHSFTPVLPGAGFDKKTCALEMCESLYDLSSFAHCRSLLNAVLPHCQRGKEHRNILIGTQLLAKLECLAGRYSNVVALLTGISDIMENVGDPSHFATQAVLLIRAYSELEVLPEAMQIAHSALSTLDSALIIQLPDVRPETSKTRRIGSAGASQTGAQTINDTATLYSGTSASVLGSMPGAMELSLEGLVGYVDVCLEVIRVLTAESVRLISVQAQYPINQLSEIDDVSEQCILRITSLEGEPSHSLLYAKVLEAKVKAIYTITLKGHAISSFRLEADSYQHRIVTAAQECADRQYEVCEVYRSLLSAVPSESEVFFLNSNMLVTPALSKEYEMQEASKQTAAAAPAGKDAKKDPKSKEVVAAPTEAAVPEKLKEQHSGILQRAYGSALVLHSHMLTSLAELKGINAQKRTKRVGSSGAVGKSKHEPTVIDKYLEESAPTAECHRNDYLTPELMQAALSATNAVEVLRGTQLEVKAKIVSISNMLDQFVTDDPLFDGAWAGDAPDPPSEVAEGQSVGDVSGIQSVTSSAAVVAEDAQPIVTELKDAIYEAVLKEQFPEVIRACSTLTECYGRREANKAALFVLLAQSVKAREQLLTMWRETLPDNSEVSCALRRINGEAFSSFKAVAMAHEQTAKAADIAFLSSSTVAYKRLSVARPIVSILSQLPTCHIVCINYSQADGALIVAGGYVANSSAPDGAGEKDQFLTSLPGEWVVEKMVLTGAEQRALQTISKTHTTFREDALKFVAAYGDQMTKETDVEVVTSVDQTSNSPHNNGHSNAGSSSFNKAEHAIAERFRGILNDIESILDPMLGSDSRVLHFLKNSVARPSSSNASQKSGASKAKVADQEMPALYLFIDPVLQNLPIEAMESISTAYNGAVVRDYSVHMTGHRLAAMAGPPAIATVKASAVSGVVDTFAEDNKTAESTNGKYHSIREVYGQLTSTPAEVAGGDKWKPVCVGVGTGISLQQWISLSSDTEGVACYVHVPGKLSSILPPTDLALMDLSKVAMAVILDCGNNDASYRRQNVVDNKKSPRELVNDDPSRIAAMLTLCGVNSVIYCQWSSSFSSQATFASAFWRALSIDKLSVHQSYMKALTAVPTQEKLHQLSRKASSSNSPNRSKSMSTSVDQSDQYHVEYTGKKWLKYSRLFYGLPTTKYDPSA